MTLQLTHTHTLTPACSLCPPWALPAVLQIPSPDCGSSEAGPGLLRQSPLSWTEAHIPGPKKDGPPCVWEMPTGLGHRYRGRGMTETNKGYLQQLNKPTVPSWGHMRARKPWASLVSALDLALLSQAPAPPMAPRCPGPEEHLDCNHKNPFVSVPKVTKK